MPVESSEVKVVIRVVDMNSGAAISGLEQNLTRMGTTGHAAGQKVAKGLDQVGEHALSSEENVRLVSETLGVRMPRAMAKAIGSSQMLMGTISAVGTAFMALGAMEIGAQIGKGLYDAYEKHLSLNKAAKDYAAEVKKNRHEDFADTRSIETTTERINEATAAVRAYQDEAAKHQQNIWSPGSFANPLEMLHQQWWAHNAQASQFDWQRQVDKLKKEREPEQRHTSNLGQIELAHASDARLRPEEKITAEKQKQLDIDREDARYNFEMENRYNPAPNGVLNSRSAGLLATLRGDPTKDRIAEAQAEAERANLQRSTNEEMIRLRNEADQAELEGIAKLDAERKAADAEWVRHHGKSAAAIADIDRKYFADEAQTWRQEQRETLQMQQAAQLAGMTGIRRAQQEGSNRIDLLNGDEKMNPYTRDARVRAVRSETAAQVAEQEKEMARRVDAIADQSADHQIGAIARIRAEATKQLDDLRREIEQTYGAAPRIGAPSTAQAAGAALLSRGTGYINAGADWQVSEQRRGTEAETSQIEADARAKSMTANRSQTAAIQTEYEERLRKYEEWKRQELATDKLTASERADIESQASRREAAAWQARNAEMIEASRGARDSMAGQFSGFFSQLDHPTEAAKSLGAGVAGQVAAALAQRIQGHLPGGTTAAGAKGLPGMAGLMDPILRRIAGEAPAEQEHAARQRGPAGTPGFPGLPSMAQPGATGPMTLATAHISVGSATISLGGASYSGAGSSAGSPMSAGGGSTRGGAEPSGGFSGGSTSAHGSHARASAIGSASAGLLHMSGTAAGASFGGGSYSGGASYSGVSYGGGYSRGGTGSAAPYSPASVAGTAAGAFNVGGSGFTGPRHSAISTIGGEAQQGLSLFQQARGTFGRSGSSAQKQLDPVGQASGLFKKAAGIFGHSRSKAANQLAQVTGDSSADNVRLDSHGNQVVRGSKLGAAANFLGAVAPGVAGMYSAVQGNGGMGGAMSGAMSGGELGLALGGPMGAAIGAAAGSVVGAIGFGGQEKARVYWLKQGRPRMFQDIDNFQQGSMDYLSAYTDVVNLKADANRTTNAMGPAAKSYYQGSIKPEISRAQANLNREGKSGRADFSVGQAQYDVGVDHAPHDGTAMIHRNERIFDSGRNERITRAVESLSGQRMPVAQGGGETHLHIHALDAKTSIDWLRANKHNVRSALNESYAENSGGADA